MTKTTLSFSVCILSFFFKIPFSIAQTVRSSATNDDEKTIVLSSPSEIPFNFSIESKNRLNEISTAKKQSETWSLEQKSQVNYWQRNHILLWNELACQLVAAYNVPPRCLSDSSGYPIPKRENAADLPRFPFANPPYAVRVFAYMSVVQHDAHIAARFYQNKFSKRTPSVYLSEDAVVDAATAAVLTYLFPAEADFIANKLEIARQSILLSEKYTSNELKAVNEFGKAIAQKVIQLAQNDGMEAAQGTERQWQTAVNRRQQAGEQVWTSIQKPLRAPIEPFFGNVKPWFTKDIATFRPSPPPSTHSEELKKEVELIKKMSQFSSKEPMIIATRWADPEFSYTPIGHWNTIACDLLLKNNNTDEEKVRILAALNRALMDAEIVCWEAKTYYCYPRPSQVDKEIHARLPLPNFPSYPSGHSTTSAAAATVLSHFFPNDSKRLFDMAEEASISRVYAALHFKMDCDAGMALGKKVGEWVIKEIGFTKP